MIKQLLLIIFTTLCCTNNLISYDYTNKDLDQSLLQLIYMINSNQESALNLQNKVDQILLHWKSELEEIKLVRDINKDAQKSFAETVDFKMKKLFENMRNNQLHPVQKIAKEVLYEFKNARSLNQITNYPLDDLLSMAEAYEDIEITVYDQMFDLQCWFEFEDMINSYIESWERYKAYKIQYIKSYFTHIDPVKHQLLKDEISECTLAFTDALVSGYQTDFQLPCDELGQSINKLLIHYSDFTQNHQN